MRDRDIEALDRLMAQLAQGERSAFDPLFRALYPRALRLARSRLHSDLAADVAQSALERVFARASEFEPGCPVLPWFYAIVGNELRAQSRRRGSGETCIGEERLEPVDAALDDPEAMFLEQERHLILDRGIASLDAASAEAIAVVLGRGAPPPIAAPTFRKRLSRAYARLRALLGDSDEG